MPVDINRLTEGWLELESDPGLFTLLLEDFGVKGVQVEEIYDLQKCIEGPVYGFIFLFRWIEERRSRRKIVDKSESFVKDEDVVNNIFFAQQMVPNSCATHALLSVLLNCPNIHLGATLSRLKAHTSGMSPENKGWAIGNTPELARAHNSHAMPQAKRRMDKSSSVSTGRYTGEAFHFVSYVPIGGKLFELDGLKPFPIDHGPWSDKEDWTEKFRTVITDRLGIASGEQYHDIRFNLMAVVPDKRLAFSHKLKMLKTNRQIVLEALTQLVKLTHPSMAPCRTPDEPNLRSRKDISNLTLSNDHSVVKLRKRTVSHEEDEKVPGTGLAATDTRGCNSDKKPLTVPKISIVKTVDKSSAASLFPSPHAILETHNYAKSPLVAGTVDSQKHCKGSSANENSSLESVNEDIATEKMEEKSISTLCPPDYSTPLTIQTSPAPSNSSTDTSSEVGSAFNSPTQGWGWNSGQSSPTSSKDFKKFVVIRVAGDEEKIGDCHLGRTSTNVNASYSVKRSSGGNNECSSKKLCGDSDNTAMKEQDKRADVSPEVNFHDKEVKRPEELKDGLMQYSDKKIDSKISSKYPELFEPHTFAPKDLLALLKNLDNEINVCEACLKDENEKRKKYKIDDCRRTHNYDEFICTFLSMLAQQGKLADLVQQHLLLHKKQGVPIGRLHRGAKKPESRNSNSRRRRGRSKYRKRK